MKVEFRGGTHLAETLAKAAEIRGLTISSDKPDLVFVAIDVEDHRNLSAVDALMSSTLQSVSVPVIVASQVPPGWTRRWNDWGVVPVYYQQNTLIMSCALERAVHPERFVIGCANPSEELPPQYVRYLGAFECPVVKMTYESAELSKLAVNYLLASQIEAANVLDGVAKKVGADWSEMLPGLRLDKRIGEHAYIKPGVVGGHLPRDLKTIERLRAQ